MSFCNSEKLIYSFLFCWLLISDSNSGWGDASSICPPEKFSLLLNECGLYDIIISSSGLLMHGSFWF